MNSYSYEEIEIGQKESFSVTVTEEMMDKFLAITGDVNPLHGFKSITGDINPLHNDADFAVKKGYKDKVGYGMLTAAYLSTLAGVYLPGEKSLIQGVELKFSQPVYVGDTLNIQGEVAEKNDTFKVIRVKVAVKNQDNKKVLKGSMQIGVVD